MVMRIEIKGNKNYCASVVKIENKIDLVGCDNICGTIIYGNHVIISTDTEIGTVGLYFPTESSISDVFLKNNNLYRDKNLNIDNKKTGFFEKTGRVKAMRLRGYISDGFFIPIESLSFLKIDLDMFKIGDTFDTINGNEICRKYFRKPNIPYGKTGKTISKKKYVSRLVDKQFRFHIDTENLGKYMYKINPDQIISVTYKLHGTSFVVGNLITKRNLHFYEKLLKKIGINIDDKEYSMVYSSRRVIKNEWFDKEEVKHYYNSDVWKVASDKMFNVLKKGMTAYGEIVGFTKSGTFIQKNYDYGCVAGESDFYIYRLTYTNPDGVVFEFSMKQVMDWCKAYNIKHVPSIYYGYATDMFMDIKHLAFSDIREWRSLFLERLHKVYLEKDSIFCINEVPEEGVVLRIEMLGIDAYKLKSFRFKELESKNIDLGDIDIEEQQSQIE